MTEQPQQLKPDQYSRTHKGFYHQKYWKLMNVLNGLLDLQELEEHADDPDEEFLKWARDLGDNVIDNIHAVEGLTWEEERASPNG